MPEKRPPKVHNAGLHPGCWEMEAVTTILINKEFLRDYPASAAGVIRADLHTQIDALCDTTDFSQVEESMADLRGITIPIRLEIDPVVLLECKDTTCHHNRYMEGCMCCNLKHVTIGLDSTCLSKEDGHEPVEA